MPVYTLKLRVPIGDMDCVTVSVPDEFHVGQMVTIAPPRPLVVQGKSGTATVDAGKSITGTVTRLGRAEE